jgi:hypothetical protein
MAKSSTSFGPGNKKGKGIPRGTKRISPEAGRDWAMRYLDEANKTLLEVMRNPEADPGVRVRAAQAVQDRAWGKVPQAIEGMAGGAPVTFQVTWPPAAPPPT